MREVTDAFLLNVAEVSATLIGLFIIGAFFYAEVGLRRLGPARESFEPYLRAGTTITLIGLALPIALSWSLVVLEPIWSRALFLFFGVALLVANVGTVRRIRAVWRATGSVAMLTLEILGTAGIVILVSLPWVLGGLEPTREDLTWSILLAVGTGLLTIVATVLSVFDRARAGRDGSDEEAVAGVVATAPDPATAAAAAAEPATAGGPQVGQPCRSKPTRSRAQRRSGDPEARDVPERSDGGAGGSDGGRASS